LWKITVNSFSYVIIMRYFYLACLNCLKCTYNDSEDTLEFAQRVK